MSRLHQALETLHVKDYPAEIPLDDLANYLRTVFKDANLIANSVPYPPGGSDFSASKPSSVPANSATKAADVQLSSARPPAIASSIEEVRKSWGKPVKLGQKDNPLGMAVFKMAAHDRHGAWFARSSVHEGLGFRKWKRAMQREFAESLAVQGGPGEGNIRGIGGDKRLEKVDVEGLGKLEVFQLSAQFPGPTTPREFITMLLSTDKFIEYETADTTLSYNPRQYMLVSIPVTHPDAPPREGLVRGYYESVEMIREIPLVGKTDSQEDQETNPVEWIMITRSDPGGGIPRFMVERGTPASIVGDAAKFFNWACGRDEFPAEDETEAEIQMQEAKIEEDELKAKADNEPELKTQASLDQTQQLSDTLSPSTSQQEETGAVTALTDINDKSAPKIFRESRPTIAKNPPSPRRSGEASPARPKTESDTSSITSFASAEEGPRISSRVPSNAYAYPPRSPSRRPLRSSSSSNASSTAEKPPESNNLTPDQARYDKEMAKIAARQVDLESRLARARDTHDAVNEQAEQRQKRELRKHQDRFEREVAKLDQRRDKEAKRLAERKRKAANKDAQRRAEMLEAENRILKEQVGSLQRENTVLAARLGKVEGGASMLTRIREELAAAEGVGGSSGSRKRATSAAASMRSADSKESKRSEDSAR